MSGRVDEARQIERALTDLALHYVGNCRDCQQQFFACEKHGRLVAAVNAASDAVADVVDVVRKLEVSK